MFCGSCWANIADGSAQCPKCQADPTAPPVAPGGAPPRAPAAPAEFEPPPKPTGDRTNQLIALVATLVILLIAGPPVAERTARRWRERGSPPPGPAAGPIARPPLAGPATAVEPAAPTTGAGPEAALMREAFELYQGGRIAEACDRYGDVVRRSSLDEARRNLGSCLARLGRDAYQSDLPVQAVGYYERALDANPSTPAVWVALALSHLKARDPGRAQGVLEQATQRFPDDPEVLYLLAEVQERQGRNQEAADVLRRLLARHPTHGRGRTLLASIEREQKVEGGYWSQESRHFVVRYEGAGGLEAGRSVVDSLEDAYDSVGRSLGHFPADRIQVSLYSQEVLGQVYRVPAHYVRGLFDGRRIRFNLSHSTAYTNDFSQLVRHEYTHAVIHELSNGLAPIWVHEGLAQIMEGRAPYGLEISVPREYLTVQGIGQLGRTGDPMAFTAGYILMHVAMEHVVDRGRGMPGVADFLRRLGRGQSVEQALREATGLGIEDVESRLRAVAGLN